MKSIAIKATPILIVLCTTLFGSVGSASAHHVALELAGPEQISAGHAQDVRAVVRSSEDGQPVAGVTVRFYAKGSFAGVTGDVVIGSAVSGQDGAAVLSYVPRTPGAHELRAEATLDGDSEPTVATWSHSVEGGMPQIYRSAAPVRVPGFDDRILMVVVSAVWLILFSVALRVIAIVRAGGVANAGLGLPVGVTPAPAAGNTGKRS